MPMTATNWSINALATEFALDRRTVARRIRDIPPAGERAGKPVWQLADVAGALAGNGGTGAAKGGGATPEIPPGFERLAGLPAVDQIATWGMLQMAYRAPAQAAALAVAAVADCETAYALHRALVVRMAGLAVEVAGECSMQPLAGAPEAALFDPAAFLECDWHALAEKTGEAVDLEAWERRAVDRFADSADG